MTFNPSIYPYSAIVRITDTIGGQQFLGSGVLLSPDEVLTASHVVYKSNIGTATNISVSPGYNLGTAPVGTHTADLIHYNNIIDANDQITFQDSQYDYAIIHLSKPFNVGTFGYQPNYAGGNVHITGYPGAYSGQMIDYQQTVSVNPSYTLFNGQDTGPGSSGGPVWITQNGTPYVVGLVSSGDGTNGYFTQITSKVFNQIKAWIAQDDANLTASQPPVVSHAITDQSATESQTFVFNVPTNTFSDPANNALTYSAQWINAGVAQPLPSWLSFDAATEIFSGTVPTGAPDLTLRVTADDGLGGRVSSDFVLSTPTIPSSSTAPAVSDVISIARLYQAALGRQPDQAGLDYYANRFASGQSIANISDSFLHSPEFNAKFGDITTLSQATYIAELYNNVLGRAPAQSEINWYVNDLNSGDSSNNLLQHFAASPENAAKTSYLNGMHQNADGSWWFQ